MGLPTPQSSRFPPAPAGQNVRLASLPQRQEIIELITSQAILDPDVSRYRRRAQFTFFCGCEPEESAGYEGQLEAVGRCLEWFVFDYVIPELETTPACHWLDRYGPKLKSQQLTDARRCLKFVLGLYEVADVAAGHGFIAIDLLRPSRSYVVREHLVSREIEPGQLLLARLFPHRKTFILSGMAALMNNQANDRIKQLIVDGRLQPDDILGRLDGIELENLFGRCVHDIAGIDSVSLLHRRLRCYLETFDVAPLSFAELLGLIECSDDPLAAAAEVCQRLEISCRHEMNLIFTYVTAAWNLSDRQ